MHILGGIIFLIIGIGIIIMATKKFKCEKKEYEEMDYSQYPVATGTVYHMHDFIGDRWIVGFPDETGKEVLGMDDMISSDTFFPNKYHIPKFGTKEKIYYWKYNGKSSFSITSQKVEYYIHFCNEKLYDLQKKHKKDAYLGAIGIGAFLIICGILIALLG
ncbi:MAG: hypothetical protein UCL21_03695 [Bacilli bacterium]|nr:hypothetical protein [Bacilli bacterium]